MRVAARRAFWLLGFFALVAGAALALDRAFPPNLSRLASGTEILDRNGKLMAVLPAPGGVWRLATTADEVSGEYRALLRATEDARFAWHPGVDPLALARAAWQWARAGRVVSGGSTITMQVARLLEPRPRTLRSKAIEILRAVQLEWRFTKRQIEGFYLTLAPMGGNVEGVRAASLIWFGRLPAQLEPEEAALLVALPQRPGRLRPDRFPDAARAARDRVLARAALPIPETPVPDTRLALPQLAPHLARRLAQENPGGRIATTLDAGLQREAERLARAAARLEGTAAAIVVLDVQNRAVRAYVAHSHPFDEARAGAIDLLRARRSPGSALKPFVYALAFDEGLLRPDTRLADLPEQFGDWTPENFDRGFGGSASVRDALRLSLNLPAVAAMEMLGPRNFAAALARAGTPVALPRGGTPALPLALGGGAVRPLDLAALYAALVDGEAAQPVFRPGESPPRQSFVGRDAARQVAGILLVTPPPPGVAGTPRIAWKSGTSWGYRDAWAAGFDAGHVVLAWTGRPDGTPVPGATGRTAAAPLLFAVFDLLPPAALPPAPLPPRMAQAAPREESLRLLFPPARATLAADAGPLTLRAQGGRRPLTWLIDGAKLPAEPFRREAAWQPETPGFYRITVLDADGRSASAEVRVKP